MVTVEDAGPNILIDPQGDRIAGVASGLDEHASLFRSYDIPAEPTDDSQEGLSTADLEVQLPDSTIKPLGDVVDEPERFSRSSIETIEANLALAAELKTVSDGILENGELEGHAAWLNDRFDELAASRPSPATVAEARDQNYREAYLAAIRPLEALSAEDNQAVRANARRLSSEQFDRVHDLRKTPLALAIELAKRVENGADPTRALLTQADFEATNPRNVLNVGNIRYASTKETKGRLSTQGTVKILFENAFPGLKQSGVLKDDTGEIRFAIFEGSETEEVAPTDDPTDIDGVTIVRRREFPILKEGDVVRFDNVFKGWWNGEPKIETRRDSRLTILERTGESKTSTKPSPQRIRRSRRSGKPVPRPPQSNWRGAERWIYPVVDWTPEWWLESDKVDSLEVATDDDHASHFTCGEPCFILPEESEAMVETESGATPEPTSSTSASREIDVEELYEAVWDDLSTDRQPTSSEMNEWTRPNEQLSKQDP
ncbi:hypothetical protein GJ629_03460 [Halapricum sp. CBA1109]|uniref:hypothetical protein n=1 Tax=Halapricum sp. CBA1109 TaxID=2668068 RepID=UPI0012FA99EA|nr:hypothetical protein [Halapricum sp. CBA1109]MUV89073.1 hypothetical protein [Halapricum sp. CBA1109]